LAHVFGAPNKLVGVIVEVAGRVRWATDYGQYWTKRPSSLTAGCWKTINGYLNQFQTMIDANQYPPRTIQLDWQQIKDIPRSRNAAICEALRSYSPCAITAGESESNASAALKIKRAQRNQER
jgi:hypothetical protein